MGDFINFFGNNWPTSGHTQAFATAVGHSHDSRWLVFICWQYQRVRTDAADSYRFRRILISNIPF